MALRHMHGQVIAEDVTDVESWLRTLNGCPQITETHVTSCDNHDGDESNWFYVEADSTDGVARLRCIGCSRVQHLLDSEERWTFPGMWACQNCGHSMAEVVLGAHVENDVPDWVAMAVRCVDCGHVVGVADAVVAPGTDLAHVIAPTSVTA